MWRLFTLAVKAFARFIAPPFVPGLLRGWGWPWIFASIALRAALACGSIVMPFSLLLSPAQMTPQERREFEAQGEEIKQVRNQIARTAGKVEAQGERLIKVENTVTDVVRGHNALDKEVSGAVGVIRSEINSAKWWLGVIWILTMAAAGVAFRMGHWTARNGGGDSGEKIPLR